MCTTEAVHRGLGGAPVAASPSTSVVSVSAAAPASSGSRRGEAQRSSVGEVYEAGVTPSMPPNCENVQSTATPGTGAKLAPVTRRGASPATVAEAGATASSVSGLVSSERYVSG